MKFVLECCNIRLHLCFIWTTINYDCTKR